MLTQESRTRPGSVSTDVAPVVFRFVSDRPLSCSCLQSADEGSHGAVPEPAPGEQRPPQAVLHLCGAVRGSSGLGVSQRLAGHRGRSDPAGLHRAVAHVEVLSKLKPSSLCRQRGCCY